METAFQNTNQHPLLPVAAELSVVGNLAGQWISMHTESIDRHRLFLIGQEYIRPRSMLEVMIWVPSQETPLHAMLSVSFIERTWEGYGVEAEIAFMSKDAQKVWNRTYRQAIARSTPGYCESIHPETVSRAPYVLIMKHALPSAVIDAMLACGLEVELVSTAAEAVKFASRDGVSLVIGAQLGTHYSGLALCRSLAMLRCPPRSLLMTERGTASDFESCLYAGATKVIAWPCSPALLVARIIDLLRSDKHSSVDEDSLEYDEDLEPALPRISQPSLVDSMSGYVSDQLHMLRLHIRTFLRSSTFERIAAFNF